MLEPFVFMAILAFNIEYPSIQDLIYTKICLQVLSQHENQLGQTTNSTVGPTNPLEQFHNQSHANLTLPSNGRIRVFQELDVSKNALTYLDTTPSIKIFGHPSETGATDRADFFSLCSMVNKSAVPKSLRQEILDLHSMFWLKYQLIVCILCALASPYWGGISDKIGRFIPLNVPLFASLLSNMILLALGILISLELHNWFSLDWLYLSAILTGLSGGIAVLISNSFSFLSDNTLAEDRTKRVTILEFTTIYAQCLGFLVSKQVLLLGITSLKQFDDYWKNRHLVAFGSIVLLNLLALIYASFTLRHRKFHRFLNNFEREQQEASADNGAASSSSLAQRQTSPKMLANMKSAPIALDATMSGDRLRELTASTPDDLDGPVARSDKSNWTFWDTMLTFSYYKATYLAAMKRRESRPIILLLLLACFISALSLATLMSLFFVYVKMDPFNWSSSKYSEWNFGSSIIKGTALVVLTLCMKFYSGWNVPDPLVAALGFLSKFSGLLLIGLAQKSAHLYFSLACFSLSEYAMPPIRSLLSKLVIKEELCKLYSCISSLQSICFILGNVAFYLAYNYTTIARADYFRAAFIVSAISEFGAVLIMLYVYSHLRRANLFAM